VSGRARFEADHHAAPAGLKKPALPRRAWLLMPAFALVLALGVGIGVYVAQPREAGLAGEAVAGHVRATLVGQSIQIASTDRHMVKPWLSARLAFSPPVADFSQDGFQLEGGRVDVIGGKPAAVLVYKRRQHMIDVYVQPGGSDSIQWQSAHDGFNVERFASGGMRYWVVSDLDRNELGDFARMLASRR